MTNSWGVDASYFRRELKSLLRTLDNRTPGELYRYFLALADVALPAQPRDKGSAEQQHTTAPCQNNGEELGRNHFSLKAVTSA